MSEPINAQPISNAQIAASQQSAARRLHVSLGKLAAAGAVKPAPADAVSLTRPASPGSAAGPLRVTGALRELGAGLSFLRRLVGQSLTVGGVGVGTGTAVAQKTIDDTLAAVRRVADAARGSLPDDSLGFTLPAQPTITNVFVSASNIQVVANALQPGESIDINVQVIQSAHTGALKLSFGGSHLDLADAESRFEIEITGPEGAQTLSFASGMSLADVIATINTFSENTGLSASLSGTGVRLDSRVFGDEGFVSVRVLDDGGISSTTAGAYEYLPDDHGSANPAAGYSFGSLQNRLTDYGQDAEALVNGVKATIVDNSHVTAVLDNLKVSFDIEPWAFQHTSFRAFTITGAAQADQDSSLARLLTQNTLPPSDDALTLLDDAIREVERVERAAILAGDPAAARPPRADDLSVIREAQQRLVDEVRRLGLLAGHDPARTLDALS